MLRKSVWLALLGLAALPAAASGACAAPTTPTQYADSVPLVFLGRALDGPSDPQAGYLYSPARFQVLAYEKGTGPAEQLVETGQTPSYGISEGLFVHPGEVWRLYGRVEGDRVLTGTCFGSHTVTRPLDPFAVRLAGRTITPLPSTLAGDTSPARAPRIRTRAATIHLNAGRPLAYVRVMRRGQVVANATTGVDHVVWTIPVPRGSSRLVLDTGDRAYAGALSRLSHR